MIKSVFLQNKIATLLRIIRRLFFTGNKVYCPCCGMSFRKFLSGPSGRPAARCPYCGSLERHRLLWLYMCVETSICSSENPAILHMAPEKCISDNIIHLSNLIYITADLLSPAAIVRFDICETPFHNDSFDFILCNHVLEHIPNDGAAIKELFRVLKPEGSAFLLSPIDYGLDYTYEDPSIISEKDRRIHFGQEDHVRIYGKDYFERLSNGGFHVQRIPYANTFTPYELERFGLVDGEEIILCRKE